MVNKIINKILILGIMTSAFLLASCEWFESGGSSGEISWSGGGGAVPQDDGLPDAYEVDGETYYGMDLYGMGAREDQVDLFIHVLTMDDVSDDGMKLQKAALDKVVDAFLEEGIHVHFDVGSVNCLYDGYDLVSDFSEYNLGSTVTHVVTEYDATSKPAISLSSSTNSGDDSKFLFVDELRDNDTYFPDNTTTIDGAAVNRNYAFHLLVFGGSQEDDGSGGSSGLAWVNGRDFLVTLGGWGFSFDPDDWGFSVTVDQLKNYVANKQASTIMHEFGHNLGLLHGGDESTNYKPNYYSIMNYLYQMQGLPVIGNNEGDRYYFERMYQEFIDNYTSDQFYEWADLIGTTYSTDTYWYYSIPIDFQNSAFTDSFTMNYSHGYGGPKSEENIYDSTGLRQSGSGSVDFNGNGSISDGGKENINLSYDSSYDDLYDYDDWTNLYYFYANNAGGGSSRSVADDTELEVAEEYDKPINFLTFLESNNE